MHISITRSLWAILTLTASVSLSAQVSQSLNDLRLDFPVNSQASPRAVTDLSISEEIEIVIRLDGLSIAEANGLDAKTTGRMLSKSAQRNLAHNMDARQSALMASVRQLGGVEVARLKNALNAVIVRIDSSLMAELADLPDVISVRPVGEYEMDLSETVPYIGAAAAQTAGIDGSGVTVAVIDSGVDYTHSNLGGPGTLEAYEAAWGTELGDPRQTTNDGLFPTDKVIGGYDFVGEEWPFGPRTEDEDPIDLEGHGTHVADIIAGESLDGTHVGVAPGAKLFAIKACSAVSSSCNGVALLLGMDYALDPNGDGDLSDAVDVINMSLGSSYGQIEDDLSLASANASRFGVVIVVSAGNSGDRPYITGSPAATPEVISVAQTQVPSAVAIGLEINTPASIAGVIFNNTLADWAPLTSAVTADVVYDVNNPLGADPFAIDLTGKAVLIDRGAVTFVTKVANAADAGAALVIIANNAGNPIPMGGTPGTPPYPPALMISTADGTIIKDTLGAGETVNVTIDPAEGLSIAGSMVSSSSRGPNVSFNAIKPDIGAPGASISAIAGSGNGVEAFGGTSGAAPMVAGSAALLLEAYPTATVGEIKARLMNNAETEVYINPALQPGVLAPITRIGAGEVRVDQAIAATTAAWADEDTNDSVAVKRTKKDNGIMDDKKATAYAVNLSFGFHTVSGTEKIDQTVRVTNYSDVDRTYTITPTFRYEDDAASGAVSVSTPGTVFVKGNSSATFKVTMHIDGSKLPFWALEGGGGTGEGSLLQLNEFDGYLVIADADDTVHIPWQVLPHRAADVNTLGSLVNLNVKGAGTYRVSNSSQVLDGAVEIYDLLGSSPAINQRFMPGPGENLAVIDLKSVGATYFGGGVGGIAISTYGRRAHPNYPGAFEIGFDTDDDGEVDYIVYNQEATGFAASGINLVFQGPLPDGPFDAYFLSFTQLNSGNIILPFVTAFLPNANEDGTNTVAMQVLAYDNYFSGIVSDVVVVPQYTFGAPKFLADGFVVVPAGARGGLPVVAYPGGEETSPSQQGLLLMYYDAAGSESDEVIVK